MIDADRILTRVSRVSPSEAVDLVGEIAVVLNSIQVQLREAGFNLGLSGDPGTLATHLQQAWNHMYQAKPLLRALERQLPDDAPIWTGDEPPLDEPPSPV